VDITVELNGLALSLMERFVFYRTHGFTGDKGQVNSWFDAFLTNPFPSFDGLVFRRDVALVHYGDDNLKAFRYPPVPHYLEVWRCEVGMVMTPADKGEAVLRPKKITEITFLKRSYVFDEELQYYIVPLDKRSIVRMLTMKKSPMSAPDHACCVLTDAHREMVYYGRSEFDSFMELVWTVVQEHGLALNGYLRLRSYDDWRADMLAGTFSAWVPTPLLEVPWIGDVSLQGMSSISLTNAPDSGVEAPLVPIQAAVTQMGEATTIVSQETPAAVAPLGGSSLQDFLQRPAHVSSVSFGSTTPVDSLVASFEPWALFLADTAVARKTANFTYIRGTIQVVGLISILKGLYGRLAISCVPIGGPDVTTIVDTVQSCMAGDYCQFLDLDSPEDIAFQLPFVWQYDHARLSAPGFIGGMWKVNIWCLAQPANSLDFGFVGGTMRFFCNLMPDYQLSGPVYQGKRKLMANAALKDLSPSLHAAIGEGKGSKMMGSVAKMAEIGSMLPVIGPYAMAAGSAARVAESVLSWFGFTRETHQSAPTPIIPRTVTNVSMIDGTDTSDYAALTMMSDISIDPCLAGGHSEDLLAVADFDSRWVRIGTAEWTGEDASLAVLYNTPVTPSLGSTSGSGVVLPAAGYRGLTFDYWRGDMEYLITIPHSSFHRGSIQVSWYPSNSAPLAGYATNVAHTVIHDVLDGDLEFSVGYASDQPYRLNVPGYSPGVINGLWCNGQIEVRVTNPLQAQTPTTSIRMCIFARAKNMDFQGPRTKLAYQAPLGVTPIEVSSGLTFQGKKIELVPSTGDVMTDKKFYGEKIQSLRAMMQKPSRIWAGNSSSLNIASPPPLPDSTFYFTHSAHLSFPFVGVASSERLKVFVRAASSEASLIAIVKGSVFPLSNSVTALDTIQSISQNGCEASVPYYRPELYRVTKVGASYSDVVSRVQPVGGSAEMAVYHSLGPDIRVSFFRGIPRVVFTAGTATTPFFLLT
jgi:hypothetical protein